jgi:F-type H+-transporting ATPase subunit alpha
MNVTDQVMVIYAGTKGFLDKVKIPHVQAWEEQFLHFMREQRADVRTALAKERKMTPALEKQLAAAITAFQPQFAPPSDGRA